MSECVRQTQKSAKQTKVGITCPDCGQNSRLLHAFCRRCKGAADANLQPL